MSKLVPLQITIIALAVVSIILSLLYHLSVEAIRIFYQEVPPSDEPTRLPPPDPKPPLFTPFGIISLVALLFTLVIHFAQPDYLEPREEEGAEELANGNDARGSRPASLPLSSSTTLSSSSPPPLSISKTKKIYRRCFIARSSIFSYPRPPLPRSVAEATPSAEKGRLVSVWFVARALPWLVLLALWIVVCVGWFVFLYAPRYRTYTLIVPGDGWMSWLDFFNTVKTVEEKWIGPYQCRNMELPCQLLLAQAILALLLVLLLLAEIIILYIGQRSLANASSTRQAINLHMQDRVRPQRQQRVHHHRGRPQSTTAVKPLPSIPEASSIPTHS